MLIHFRQGGGTLLEVLITIVITAFGLLGLAGLQGKIQVAETEAYQRGQAILLASDMAGRIQTNGANASTYVTATPLGSGDSEPADCASVTAGVLRDRCEWSNALKGAAEKSAGADVGAMIGARGCVTQVQAPDTTANVCTPGIYLVTVAWQGLSRTAAPRFDCGRGSYGEDSYRRAIGTQVSVGLPSCSYS